MLQKSKRSFLEFGTNILMIISQYYLSLAQKGAMTFSIMTFSVIDLIVTLSIKNIQHNDTKNKH